MHYGIQLTANLEIQLSDMVVNQRFVELLHRLTGFADAVHKHLHRRRQAFTRRSVRKRGVIQKRIDITQAGGRGQVDFFKQGGVNALVSSTVVCPCAEAVFQYSQTSAYSRLIH